MTHDPGRRLPGLATLAIHAGGLPERTCGQAATTHDVAEASSLAEERLAILEGGSAAVATVSGLAAHLLVLHALLDPGDQVLASTTVFGESRGRMADAADEFGWTMTGFDPADTETLANAVSPAVKAIVIESMTAGGRIIDLTVLAAVAARAEIPLVVDNTLATPALIRPISSGAHVVVHAGSVRLAGDDSAECGFVVDGGGFDWSSTGKLARPRVGLAGASLGERFGNFALAAALRTSTLRDLGTASAPSDLSAILAGLATLSLRVQRQSDTALAVARHLLAHPAFENVGYAGLDRDLPQAGVAGSVLTASLKNDSVARRSAFFARLQLFAPEGPQGSTRSHGVEDSSAESGAIRFSIGLEDACDLIADLDQAVAVLA